MKNILLFLLSMVIFHVYSQNDHIKDHVKYNTYFWLAQIEMKNQNYKQAICYFDSASMIFPHFHKPYYESGVCAAFIGNFNEASSCFEKMISTGTPFTISTSYLNEFSSSSYYINLIQKSDSLYTIALQAFDLKFAEALDSVCSVSKKMN